MSVPGRKVSDLNGSAPDSHGSESQDSSSDIHDSLSHGSIFDSKGLVAHGSVSCGSDEDFNHDCEPCLTEGQHIQAHGYCVECKEYLCRNCFRYHQRTRALQHHQLLDKTNTDNLAVTVEPSETCTEKCEIHRDEIIKIFCPEHDVLGCSDCMTMNHRVCNIDYIPDICNDIVDSAEYKDVITQLDQKTVEADSAVKKANEKDSLIDKCHEQAKQDMDKFQIEIIQLISEKHKQIQAEIDARKSADKTKIKNLMTSCTQVYSNINQLKSNIADSKANKQNGQMFIAIMRAKSHLKSDVKEVTKTDESLEKTNVEYTFAYNQELKGIISKYGKFGQLINSTDKGNVRLPEDSHEENSKMSHNKDTANSNWDCFTDSSKIFDDSNDKDKSNSLNWTCFTDSSKILHSNPINTGNSDWASFTDSSKIFDDSNANDTGNSIWDCFTDSSKISDDSKAKDTSNSNWTCFTDSSKIFDDQNAKDTSNSLNFDCFTDSSKILHNTNPMDTGNSTKACFTDRSKMLHTTNHMDTGNSIRACFTDRSQMLHNTNPMDTGNSTRACFTNRSKMLHTTNHMDTGNSIPACFTDRPKMLHTTNHMDTGNSIQACFTDRSKIFDDSNSKVSGNSKPSNEIGKAGRSKMPYDFKTKKMSKPSNEIGKSDKSEMPYTFKTKKTDAHVISNDSQNAGRHKTSKFNDSKRDTANTVTPHSFLHGGYIDIKTETDLETSGISAFAFLSFDRLLLADTDNMKLKIVEVKRLTSAVIDEKILESPPWDLALLPKEQAAVTLPDQNKILLVSTARQLSIKNTIHVEGVCRDLTYNQDCLYVVCWNPYCVFVLEMDGKIKHAIPLPSNCLSPYYIVYNPVFQLIYVSDMGRHSIYSLTLQGDITAIFTHKGLRPLGMVMLDDGSLLVCNQFSNSIQCISGDLKHSWQVIAGLKSWKPLSIIYSGDYKEVCIEASNSDQLKTYNVL